MTQTWSDIASSAQKSLLDSIPAKWRLPQPLDPSLTDVRSVPRTCGLLTENQLEITERTASELVAQLREGKLSSVDVTEAFCARAAIAHQCVNQILHYQGVSWTLLTIRMPGQLFDSVLSRRSSVTGKGIRRYLENNRQTSGTFAWITRRHQRYFPHERKEFDYGLCGAARQQVCR